MAWEDRTKEKVTAGRSTGRWGALALIAIVLVLVVIAFFWRA